MINYLKRSFIINILIVLIIFFLDRFSKIFIIAYNEKSLSADLFSSKFLNISLIWNEGIAFGLFSFDNKLYYNLLTILICLITIIIIWLLLKSKGLERLSFLMIVGGSLGNIFDRIFYSAVPDFIDIHINNFHWFIFNVADIFITLGILCLISIEIVGNKKIKNENY